MLDIDALVDRESRRERNPDSCRDEGLHRLVVIGLEYVPQWLTKRRFEADERAAVLVSDQVQLRDLAKGRVLDIRIRRYDEHVGITEQLD